MNKKNHSTKQHVWLLGYGMARYGTYGMLWYVNLHYGTLWYGTIRYGTLRYVTVYYGTLRYVTVWYGMVWNSLGKIYNTISKQSNFNETIELLKFKKMN